MSGFLTRKIVTIETLGEKLRKVREGKNLTLEEVAKKINIQAKYLAALENGDYHHLPGGVYIKNFLIEYAKFLGLDQNLITEFYEKEKFSIQEKKFIPPQKSLVLSQVLKKFLQILIVFFILFYLGWGIKKIVFPPSLTVISPDDNFITRENPVKIIGQTEEEAIVMINDKLADSNFKGRFEEEIELKPGLNIIKISATKKHSRERVITRRVMFIETN